MVNRVLQMYLRCLANDQLLDWSKWIAWVEYCYNASWHSTIQCTPFQAVHGRKPPPLLNDNPGTANSLEVDAELHSRNEILKLLRSNLELA